MGGTVTGGSLAYPTDGGLRVAIPEYFRRNAVAIAQAVSGLDEAKLESRLAKVCIGITIGNDAGGDEGRAMADLLIRLFARLYPSIVVCDEGGLGLRDQLSELAHCINPRIAQSGNPTIEVVVGSGSPCHNATRTVFAGSSGWRSRISTQEPQKCGASNNPFGSGLAACFVAADVFRRVFVSGAEFDGESVLAVPNVGDWATDDGNVDGNVGSFVLAGAGAIGNAAVWALSRTRLEGTVDIVDHETIDLGNLQRYTLAEFGDVNRVKAPLLAGSFDNGLVATPHVCSIAEFLERNRHRVENLLLALDSAKDRCGAQASLPRRVINAWTQPGDLGVSSHDFLEGACVNCLYLPDGEQKNEDQVIAESFGVPDRLMQIRTLLHKDEGATKDLLDAIAKARDVSIEKLLPFEGRSLRSLYTEGICGGAVIPLGEIREPRNDVHVPLAHQSAMAGVLLAAAGVRKALEEDRRTVVARYDVLKPQAQFQVYPAAKDPEGRCLCQDRDYVEVYRDKYGA